MPFILSREALSVVAVIVVVVGFVADRLKCKARTGLCRKLIWQLCEGNGVQVCTSVHVVAIAVVAVVAAVGGGRLVGCGRLFFSNLYADSFVHFSCSPPPTTCFAWLVRFIRHLVERLAN